MLEFLLPAKISDCHGIYLVFVHSGLKKSRIQETKHLSTDAESSTDAIGGGTKNTPKPNFFWKKEKIIQKLKNV